MNHVTFIKKAGLTVALAIVTTFGSTALASAEPAQTKTSAKQTVITNGTQKIDNRLRRLDTLQDRIQQTRKLSTANKAYLTSEVADTKTQLTELKSELESADTAKTAREITKKVIEDNRVYLVVVKKVQLAKLSDHLTYKQNNLVAFAELINQTLSTAGLQNGVQHTNTVTQIISDTKNSIAETAEIQKRILAVTPDDFNKDKQVLHREFTKLKEIRKANVTSYSKLVNIANKL